MSTLAQRLAAQITGAREVFAKAFASAQDAVRPADRKDFKVVATTGVDLSDFELCFDFADQKGWLEELVTACIQAQLAAAKLLGELRVVEAPGKSKKKKAAA